jgi:hypothetical protein
VGAGEGGDGEPEIHPFPLWKDKEGLVALIVHKSPCALFFNTLNDLMDLGEEVVDRDPTQPILIHIQYFFGRSIEEIDLSFWINGQKPAIETLDDISIEGFKLVIVVLLLDQFAPFPFQFLGDHTAKESHNIKSRHIKNERIEELTGFKNIGELSDRMDHPIVLKEEEKSIEQGRKRGREKSPASEEDDTTPNDGEDIGHREKAVFPAGEENESNNEKMIEHHLNECESTEILDGPEQEIVKDGDQVEEPDEVVEAVR